MGAGLRRAALGSILALLVLGGAWKGREMWRMRRNERLARERMCAIIVAQQQHLRQSFLHSYAASLIDLEVPTAGCREPLPEYETAGYRYRVFGLRPVLDPVTGETIFLHWGALAWPVEAGRSGRRIFYADDRTRPDAEKIPSAPMADAPDIDALSLSELIEFVRETWPERIGPLLPDGEPRP
jgi:hypothetical protein